MTLRRAAVLAAGLGLALAAEATAQAPFPAGPQAAPMQAPPMQGVPPCYNEFMPLRQEAEKRAAAIKAASERKAQRPEICQLVTRFSEAEGKFAKYIETNQTWCGIPPQVVAQIKANHAKTAKTRTQVCSTAPLAGQGPALPPGPGLSDALGTNRVPDSNTTSTGKGTFDTLTGNPIR